MPLTPTQLTASTKTSQPDSNKSIVHPLKKPNICRWSFDKGTELPLDNSIDQAMRNVKQITFTYYIVMRFGLILGLLESLSLT